MSAPSTQTSLITYLTGQHRGVSLMFGQLEKQRRDPTDQVRTLTDQVIITLMKHSVAEERYLYPVARQRLSDGDELADREIAEHDEAERTMKELEGLEPTDAEFWPKLQALMDEIRQHVHEEEFFLFPRLQAACSDQELLELGRQVQQAEKTAPTRPHPSSPNEGTALSALAPGVGMVDRLRDALTGRG